MQKGKKFKRKTFFAQQDTIPSESSDESLDEEGILEFALMGIDDLEDDLLEYEEEGEEDLEGELVS